MRLLNKLTYFTKDDITRLEAILKGYRTKDLNKAKFFGHICDIGIDMEEGFIFIKDSKGNMGVWDDLNGEFVDHLECPLCHRQGTLREFQKHPTPCCTEIFCD